jgi:hypothetical protein
VTVHRRAGDHPLWRGAGLFQPGAVFDWLSNRQVDPDFWGEAGPPADAAAFQRWIYGLLGATAAGWGVFMAALAVVLFLA